MIYINNNYIDLNLARGYKGDNALFSFLSDKIAEVDSFPGDTITYKLRSGIKRRNKLQGIKEGKHIQVCLVSTINTPRGSETWVCTNSIAKDAVTGVIKPKPKHKDFGENWTLRKDSDLDRILYMMCAASPTRGANPKIIIEDLSKEARNEFNKDMDSAKVKLMLYEMSGNALHQLAMACGISNPSSKSDDILRSTVFNKIEFDVRKRVKTYEEYLAMGKDSSNSKILATIQEGVDMLIIAYSDRKKAYGWLGPNETWDSLILDVPPAYYEQKESLLASHLSHNSDAYTRLVTQIKAMKEGNMLMSVGKFNQVEVPAAPTTKAPDYTPPPTTKAPDYGAGSGDDEQLGSSKVIDSSEVFKTPEGPMNLDEMEVWVAQNQALPFIVGEPTMNKVARALGISLAMANRPREMVYDEIKAHFNLV